MVATAESGSGATPGHGHQATRPWAIPARGWKDVALRSWQEAGQDNISLIASGVAFCGVLAMVPMLGAIVLSYGLIATPETVMENVRSLTSVMPADAARLIGEQLANIVNASDGKKGFGLLVALGIAFYGAMKGATAIITALNVAYDEEETRSFIKLNLLALGITAGGVLIAILAVVAITAMSSLETLFPSASGIVLTIGRLLSHVVMAGVGAAAAATLYRYAPNRQQAQWVWLSPGSLLASLTWVLMTLGFGIYVSNFGSYDATYGSLGAAVVLLTWLYLSAYVLLLGAEFNCELERQTAQDTTTGVARPLGKRGAYAADTVAKGPNADPEAGPGPSSAAAKPAAERPATPPGMRAELVTGRGVDRALRLAGVGKAGLLPSVLATTGLALIGRRDRAALGIALLAASGGVKWLTASRPPAQPGRRRTGPE
jgi:membrane protein